jgi:predicted Na+-dependent transporter
MAVVFELYDQVLGAHFVFAVPTPALLHRLTLMLALPLLAGMALRRARPGFVERHANTARRVVLAAIACLLAYIWVTQYERMAAEWQQTAVAVVVFMALAMAIAVTILNRIEYPVFAVAYFLTEVPLLLGAAAVYRRWRTQAVQRTETPGTAR